METKNNIKRKKKVKIESKQPTYLTYGKNHPKIKTKKNTIKTHKIENKEYDMMKRKKQRMK